MKIFIKLLLAGLPVLLITSCKKYLNVTPDNVATLNSSFSNANETEAYLFGCYNAMQQLGDVRHNAGFTTSGEVIFPSTSMTGRPSADPAATQGSRSCKDCRTPPT